MGNFKLYFQDIHYQRQKPNLFFKGILILSEFFYKNIINFKNLLYEKNILKEKKVNAYVICIGNLTTGGVGKTPIVENLANELSETKKVTIISRGYGAKISNKNPIVIKSENKIHFKDGRLCSDEAFQLAKKTKNNVNIIICADRLKAAKFAINNFKTDIIILDDGFSNRKLKKDKTILVIDSKMRFGNNHLLPYGPLRESIKEIKRADEIILVNKADENLNDTISWAKKEFNKPIKICNMIVDKIYNIQTKAQILKYEKAIAFCAIGQPIQFYNFAKQFYKIVQTITFADHHKYSKDDIEALLTFAKKYNINTFITTQKDETKLYELIKDIKGYCFNVLSLKSEIKEI